MGSLVKSYLPTLLEDVTATPNMLYHVAVMPCYDKKLEASRQDFYDDIYATRDVDCVITTGQFITYFFYFNYFTLPLGGHLLCCPAPVRCLPGRQSLRSTGTNHLVPPVKQSIVSSRVFPVAGTKTWNTLPEDVTSSQSEYTFYRQLKTWLFRKSFPDIII